MKVLVPFDIVHPVKPIIDQLKVLLPLKDMHLQFLYVREEFPSYERLVGTTADFSDDWGHQVDAKARAALQEAADLVKNDCAQVSTELVVGPPAFMIETVARNGNFDMTVVTPFHEQVQTFLMGSTAGNVVKHGSGTVLICRPSATGKPKLSQVLMGIDGSEQSKNAVKLAASQFNLKEAAITLVHFVSVPEIMKMVSPGEYISMVENNLLMEGETFLADGKRILADAGVTNVSVVLKEGDPSTEMLKHAHSLPADLIVIGAQGRTAVQHFLLGSVSVKISMHAPCATAVIKPEHQ